MTFMYFVPFQLWHIVSLDAIQTKHASKSHDKTMFYQQYKNKNWVTNYVNNTRKIDWATFISNVRVVRKKQAFFSVVDALGVR